MDEHKNIVAQQAHPQPAVGSTSFDAPLQTHRPPKPIAGDVTWNTRLQRFIRRRGMSVLGCAAAYTLFFGLPVHELQPHDDKSVVALRCRFWQRDHNVAVFNFKPAVQPGDHAAPEIDTSRAFSLLSGAPQVDPTAYQDTQARKSVSERLSRLAQRWVPTTLTYGIMDSTRPSGWNLLQYNRALFKLHRYSERKNLLVGVDGTTKDKNATVHVAFRVLYREEIRKVDRFRPGMQYGVGLAMTRYIATQEVDKWINSCTAEAIKAAPPLRQRGGDSKSSLAVHLPGQLLDSVIAHARGEVELSDEEQLRRLLVANITRRTKGSVVVEDVTWKISVDDVVEHERDPLRADSWGVVY